MMSSVLGTNARPAAELPALAGGALCLDFANTLDDRTDPDPVEHLPTYGALLAWSLHAGAIDRAEARRLAALAGQEPGRARAALRTALAAREAVYTLFSERAAGVELSGSLLDPLNRVLRKVGAAPRLEARGSAASLEWDAGPDVNLHTPTSRALHSAVDLLTGPDLARVRQCSAPDCSWLFLDMTRNHNRRWCRAEGCGTRNRFRRYYARHRKEG